jgi:hypothetical protein
MSLAPEAATVFTSGVRRDGVGVLLWPGVVIHAILIALLTGAWLKQRKGPAT